MADGALTACTSTATSLSAAFLSSQILMEARRQLKSFVEVPFRRRIRRLRRKVQELWNGYIAQSANACVAIQCIASQRKVIEMQWEDDEVEGQASWSFCG